METITAQKTQKSAARRDGSTSEAYEKIIRIFLDATAKIPSSDLPASVLREIKERLTFDNPRYLQEARFGKIRPGTTRLLRCVWESDDHLIVARGFVHELIRIFNAARLKFEIKDRTVRTSKLEAQFGGELTEKQKRTLDAIEKRRFGIIAGPNGSGKYDLALRLVSDRKKATLVIVKTKARMHMWREAAQRLLGLDDKQIGLIGAGRCDLDAGLTIAIDRSLYRNLDILKGRVGFLIVDQCDAANLKIFTDAVKTLKSYYMLGLASASSRPDGLDGVMKAYLGPILCELECDLKYRGGGAGPPTLYARPTGFKFDFRDNFGELMTTLSQDPVRNEMIGADILEAASDPKMRAIVVCERIEQAQRLKSILDKGFVTGAFVCGRTSSKQLESVQRKFDQGSLQVILATQKSVPKLSVGKANRLFIASPHKYGEHLFHAMGRLLEHQEKKESLAIHDYMDEPEVLKASFKQRLKQYRTMGLSYEKMILEGELLSETC